MVPANPVSSVAESPELEPSIAAAGCAIAAHGAIGDQRTAALVADDGTVDFLCWPNLDSPSVFAALLDNERGGAWQLAPQLDRPARRQAYLTDTNVLRTVFSAPDGMAEIVDFMPFPEAGGTPRLVRRVRVARGSVRFRMRCSPRFDYARAVTEADMADDGSVVFRAPGFDGPALRLTGTRARQADDRPGETVAGSAPTPAPVLLAVAPHAAVADFTLRSGEQADFVLLDADAPPPGPAEAAVLLDACIAHWHGWVAGMSYRGRWREMVTRSALALKLLVSEAHGSIAAAVTFGLPESQGGGRNWDYRASWLRDASFTVYAFMRLGYVDEANAFYRWVGDRARDSAADGALQIMYGLDGRKELEERELPHLRGCGGAAPVRIGNAAFRQMQLDIYGELLDAGYLANKYGGGFPQQGWLQVTRVVDYVCAHWRRPDQGIWEVRGEARCWLHSRLMCWVALDRALRLAAKRSLPAPTARWQAVRDEIHASIWAEFWDAERGHFVAASDLPADAPHLDAAMLMMPLVRFVSGRDPQWLATLDAIGRELAEGPLVCRYRGPDGLAGSEGAFTACSFWYVECLARAGRLESAREMFDAMLGYANPLGLFSEEIGSRGEQLGNTPQALTHLALISAAFYLDRALEEATPARPTH